jgi:pyrroline-5-carboxylate reductase
MLKDKIVAIIGGGNMGEVIASGIISTKLTGPEKVTVSDALKDRLDYLHEKYRVNTTEKNEEAVGSADIVILAVKPQNMREVLQGIADVADGAKIFISIAAGIPLRFIEGHLGKNVRVLRVMPNTPALVGEGAAAIAAGENATDEDVSMTRRIFDSVGISVVVEEKYIDAVTGLSGSGPAYGFMIIEALTEAGVKMGLERETALILSAQTLLGAAKLCLVGDKTPAELTDMVTSPGGTTIEGIKELKGGKLKETLISAVEAATQRSKELASAE